MGENPIQQIGRYEIEREIGRGGMAIVYKARDPHLDRVVAIKLIRRGNFTLDQLETLPERFKREARALARLNHPNIVQVYDYGYYEDMPYLVMEYIEGVTLKEVRKPLKVTAAARLLRPIAEALDYVHSQGLLHRDVKPSNIMITQDKKVRLTDFGIAKFLDDSANQQTLTGTGVGIGTPEYTAPEQGLGQAVDARSDQYALSVVFYELITGHKPFTGDTPIAILTKQAIEPFPDPRQFVPELSESVTRFFECALAKDPANRYETMSDYLRDLDGLRLQSMSANASDATFSDLQREKNTPKVIVSTSSSVRVSMDDQRKIRAAAGVNDGVEPAMNPISRRIHSIQDAPNEKSFVRRKTKKPNGLWFFLMSVVVLAFIFVMGFGLRELIVKELIEERSIALSATIEAINELTEVQSTVNSAFLSTQGAETARAMADTFARTQTQFARNIDATRQVFEIELEKTKSAQGTSYASTVEAETIRQARTSQDLTQTFLFTDSASNISGEKPEAILLEPSGAHPDLQWASFPTLTNTMTKAVQETQIAETMTKAVQTTQLAETMTKEVQAIQLAATMTARAEATQIAAATKIAATMAKEAEENAREVRASETLKRAPKVIVPAVFLIAMLFILLITRKHFTK